MFRKYYRILIPIILLVSGLIIAGTTPIPMVMAYGTGHPDQCQPCHGIYTEITDVGTNVWDHKLYGGDNAWGNCTQCHSNYVSGTVHESLGCMGCHSVLHLGYNNTGNWAAWIFAREADLTTITDTNPLMKPEGTFSWVLKSIVVTEDNATTTGYNFINNYGTGDGMEIEVGIWDAFNNKYMEIGTSDWRVCFSCHFLADNPAQVGAYKLVGGVWKIGIPEFALKLPPHEITSAALAEAAKSESTTISPSTLLGVLLGLLAVGLVVYSKREIWM